MDFSNFFLNNIEVLLPEIFFSFSIVGIILYGAIVVSETHILTRYTNKLALCIVATLILLTLNTPAIDQTILSNSFFQDNFVLIIKLLLLISVFSCIILSENTTLQMFEYSFLILLSLFGLILLVMSFDLISLYLAIEIQSLCFYILASLKKNSAFSTEAGLKYFILGALSSGLLLFGCSLIYGTTGTTNFEHLTNIFIDLPEQPLLIVGSLCLLAAIFFKLAVAPFHMWSPDVYEGAPTNVTAFFAIVPKLGIFFVLIRFLNYVFYDVPTLTYWWSYIGGICAILSIGVGSITAIQQKRIKRLLAYSAVGHVGYLLIGLFSGGVEGIQAVFFYLILYIITSICIWGSLLGIQNNNNVAQVRFISELKTVYTLNPFMCFTLVISFFSLAGVPPLAGFLSKFGIFFSAIASDFYFVVLFAVFMSVISTFYYLRVIKTMIFEQTPIWNTKVMICSFSKSMSILISLGFFSLFILFIFPTPLYLFTYYMSLMCF
jgi:NADH-quinone oxidoreductase subunit N